MNEKVAVIAYDGTAAIDMAKEAPRTCSARIIAFPSNDAGDGTGSDGGVRVFDRVRSNSKRLATLVESSEMLCSLALEDFRGCAYGVFQTNLIRNLSIGCAVVAAISLAFGV